MNLLPWNTCGKLHPVASKPVIKCRHDCGAYSGRSERHSNLRDLVPASSHAAQTLLTCKHSSCRGGRGGGGISWCVSGAYLRPLSRSGVCNPTCFPDTPSILLSLLSNGNAAARSFSQRCLHKHGCPGKSPDFSWEAQNVSDHKSKHSHTDTTFSCLTCCFLCCKAHLLVIHHRPLFFSLSSFWPPPHPGSCWVMPPQLGSSTSWYMTQTRTILTRGWLLSRGLRGLEWGGRLTKTHSWLDSPFFFFFIQSLFLPQPQAVICYWRLQSRIFLPVECVGKRYTTYRPWTKAH